jgi:predicted nucleotidyltransferase
MSAEDAAEFEQFVTEVEADFRRNRTALQRRAQAFLPSPIRIVRVGLSGSYGRGEERPDSDVDLEVVYRGKMSKEDVAEVLYGRLSGYGGVYDIHPRRVE